MERNGDVISEGTEAEREGEGGGGGGGSREGEREGEEGRQNKDESNHRH